MIRMPNRGILQCSINNSSVSENRIHWADNVKTIAIILVVWGHSSLEEFSSVLVYIRTWIYEFHMPLFFMMSGLSFAILPKKKGNKPIFKQVLNIVMIFIIQSIVYILFSIVKQRFIPSDNGLTFKNLYTFFVNPVVQFWYLYALFFIYLIEMLLDLIRNRWIRFALVLVLTCVGYVTSIGRISITLYELLYFEIGTHICDNKDPIPFWIWLPGCVLSFVMPAVQMNNYYLKGIVGAYIALSISMFIIKLCKAKLRNKYNCFTNIGTSCLWIFIFHTYFISLVRAVCIRVLGNFPIASVFIVTVLSVIGPLIVMVIFKKIKIDRIVTEPISYVWK